MYELSAGDASVVVRPEAGGRIASLVVDGLELLVTDADRPIDWGLFPMAPFAGRIGFGHFTFDGRDYDLPLTLPPHAIHGTLVTREWTVVDESVLEAELQPPWPFRGRVRHEIHLQPESLELTLTIEADEPMPGWVGWHPWFRRRLGRGARAELDLPVGSLFERNPDGLPTGELVSVSGGPWDDCFTDLVATPCVRWPDALSLEIHSTAAFVVVFTEPAHALCVEPQTAPPDAIRLGRAPSIEPGQPHTATMTLRWRSLR